MITLGTVRELFAHNDWARDKLLAVAADLPDTPLDRPFEMGEGTLRATLRHLYGAERNWLERWRGTEQTEFPHARALSALAELRAAWLGLADARNGELANLTDGDLQRQIAFRHQDGQTYTFAWGDILLHVCNHGVHHRAQAVNMLRCLGAEVPKPGIDYIFLRLERADDSPPRLALGALRAYLTYGDWAWDRVQEVAAELSDAQLDRPFELGSGSVRHALAHIHLAEQWWLGNWTLGPGRLFPEADPAISITDLTGLFRATTARRNEYMANLTDADLLRPTTATPRPGVSRTFPLGCTMLQLCCHGTHHRAQVLNMFRHVGAAVPRLDYVTMVWNRR